MADESSSSEFDAIEAREQVKFAEQQKLRAQLHNTVTQITRAEEGNLGVDFSKKAIAVVTKVLADYTEVVGTDLETFARHARRRVINIDDVKLCARKNPDLSAAVQTYVDEQGLGTKSTSKKRKTR